MQRLIIWCVFLGLGACEDPHQEPTTGEQVHHDHTMHDDLDDMERVHDSTIDALGDTGQTEVDLGFDRGGESDARER